MNTHSPRFLKVLGADIGAVLGLLVAVALFFLLVMGGVVLLFGPPHFG